MRRLRLLFKRIRYMSFDRMNDMISRVKKESNKSYLYILFDMVYCALRYNVGYLDYYVFGFVFCNATERQTYMTMPLNNRLFKDLNEVKMANNFNDKLKFNEIFNDYLGRQWLDLRVSRYEDFVDFTTINKTIIVKPVDAFSGKGIEKIVIDADSNITEIYDSLIAHEQFVVEECLVQHEKMNVLNPSSINTLRITSLIKNNAVHIMYVLIRTSDGTKFIDNIGSGGFYAPVDDSGRIFKPGFTEQDGIHDAHPLTKTMFVGFEVPLYDDAVELVKTCAALTPEVRYCGWDVAITPKGPVLIEGNPMPGYDIPQNHFHLPTRIGLLPKFSEVLKEEI